MIGKTLGHYQITEKLGEGGMGVVYKARDTHLDRFVAIKVLPAEKVADPDRKRRFVQEAKAASALNHPNIVTIHDITEEGGTDFIVMEYVAGKTLDDLIPRKGMRLSPALKHAVQIADAVSRAHGVGIIHRDLKPSNVMVDEHGLVKVLDFGLAKLTEAAGPEVETAATRTGAGMILGTAAYMSPEQAEGKKVDARSDIFSFGSMLYEMLTGQRAFRGDTRASTIASILREEPKPISQVAEGLPREVERIVKRCMRKDPVQRFQHMDDLKVALEELKEESDSGTLETAGVARPKPRHRLVWAFGVVAALAVGVIGVWLVRFRGGAPEAPLVAVPLTSYPGSEHSPSFSPDGNQVAFVWDGEGQDNSNIYVKQVGIEPPSRLTNDPAEDVSPAWSPDGQFIAFLRKPSPTKMALMLIPQRGGQERTVAEIGLTGKEQPLWSGPYLSWTPDSKWIVCPAPEKGQRVWALFLFSTETGEQRKLTSPLGEEAGDTTPAVSPDGRSLVFSRLSPDLTNSALCLLRLGEGYAPLGKEEKVPLNNMTNAGAAWMPDGNEIVFGSGTGTDFGLWRMAIFKDATPRRLEFAASAASSPTVSRQGNRLAYAVGRGDPNIWRVDLKPPGQEPGTPVKFVWSTQSEGYPAYSPDGRRIAFVSNRSGTDELWLCDSSGSKLVRLTSFGGSIVYGPKWSWDGQNIGFTVVQKGMKDDIYVISANGGTPRRLTTHPAEDKWPYWSRDGRWIYFTSTRSGQDEIWKMPATGGESVQITRNFGDTPAESPDGKFLYYMKGWPGIISVWRMPCEGGKEAKVLDSVSPHGQWVLGNEGIYFRRIADAQGHADLCLYRFATGETKRILTIRQGHQAWIAVSPDGQTVLYMQFDEAGSDLMLVENFR